jgi:SAM-dependent MidA family methyltransferase
VITVDYGAERDQLLSAAHRQTGTLRAIHRHQFVDDILANPGEQDLTTTVDWTQIREAGRRAGLQTVRYESLHRFLLDEGLLEEIEKLASARPSDSEVLRLRTGAREMIMPHGLAASFQILVQQKS